MEKSTTRYVNFRATEEIHDRIRVIASKMSEALDMRVSMAYVARMAMENGLKSLEMDVD